MVHKNYKWNIPKEKGQKIVFNLIEKILKEKKDQIIDLDELTFLLNNRTKNMTITNNNKHKNIVNFIKNVFGGIVNFIDDYENFLIEIRNDDIIIKLNKLEIEDWVFIEDNYEE